MKNFIREKNKYLHLCLYALLLGQIAFLVVLNLVFLDYYIGYDSSAVYLQVVEIWNQGTFLIDNWHYTTTTTWDTPLLFAVPFYGLLGDVFLAYGIGNLISLALFAWACYHVLSLMGADKTAKLLFFVSVLTPYVSFVDTGNRIDYFAVMLSLLGVYSLKTALMLLLWIVFWRLDHPDFKGSQKTSRKTTLILAGLSLFFSGFTAMSSGFHVLVFGILPPLCYLMFRNIIQDSWTKPRRESLCFLIFAVVFSVIGKVLGTVLVGYGSFENSMGWIEIAVFWDNFLSILLGYFSLTGALPVWESPAIFSGEGIGVGFMLALSLGFLLTGMGSMWDTVRQKKWNEKHYFSGIFFFMLLIFVFVSTKYGAYFFEVRYLIPNFVILVLFASIWLSKQLHSSNQSAIISLLVTVLPCLVVVNLVSYYYIYQSRNDNDLQGEIKDYVSSIDSPVIYALGNTMEFFSCKMNAFDLDHSYLWTRDSTRIYFWGVSGQYTDAGDHQGASYILAYDFDFDTAPQYIQSQYEVEHVFSTGNLMLYRCEENIVDFVAGVSDRSLNVDYPYTYGVEFFGEGEFLEDGSYWTKGEDLIVLYTPFETPESGVYDFTLYYELGDVPSGSEIGVFDLCDQESQEIHGSVSLSQDTNHVTVENIAFPMENTGDTTEYRVLLAEGVEIFIHKIEIAEKG
ncbi:MAG: hypothetical protein R3Y63_03010 [Eubacteriales bacterium]